MRRYFRQLQQMQEKYTWLGEKVPIICGGDIFDRWNPIPETINFLIKYMPTMYAVPGQHDLPNHRYKDIRKSGYKTLVEAGKIIDLKPKHPVEIGNLRLHGFPWGHEVTPLLTPHDLIVEIAVIHAYIWVPGCHYTGAPIETRAGRWLDKLKGYDVAVFGDNHSGFCRTLKNIALLNNGTFFKRKSDERHYTPCVGLIYNDGTVERAPLDVSKDKFLDERELAEKVEDERLDGFVEELQSLSDAGINFQEAVQRALDKINPEEEVRKMILGAMEEGK